MAPTNMFVGRAGMSMMRAVQYDRYGSPDELAIRNVPVPPVRPGSVLVKVRAFSIIPIDAVVRRGELKLMSGRKFPKGTGLDFTGEVAWCRCDGSRRRAGG